MARPVVLCAVLALCSCRTTPERESKVIILGAASESVVLYGVAKKKCPTADLGVPGVAVKLSAGGESSEATSAADGTFHIALNKALESAPTRSLTVAGVARAFDVPGGLTFTMILWYPCEGEGEVRLQIAEPATSPRNPRYPSTVPNPDEPLQRPDPVDPTLR